MDSEKELNIYRYIYTRTIYEQSHDPIKGLSTLCLSGCQCSGCELQLQFCCQCLMVGVVQPGASGTLLLTEWLMVSTALQCVCDWRLLRFIHQGCSRSSQGLFYGGTMCYSVNSVCAPFSAFGFKTVQVRVFPTKHAKYYTAKMLISFFCFF